MHDKLRSMWDAAEIKLKIFQTMAILEVAHSILGFVRSPWKTTFMQVLSRLFMVWYIVNVSGEAQTSIFFVITCTSWALVEVVRYLFYSVNLLGEVPYPLFWLRYSLFWVLYVTGVIGEIGCMASSLRSVDRYEYDTLEPSSPLLIFRYFFTLFAMFIFMPGFYIMYTHMIKTSRKQLKEYKQLNRNIKEKQQ